jgi:hypothetical protein
VKYLKAVEAYGKRFPGFGREVQNVHPDANGDMWAKVVATKSLATRPGPRRTRQVREGTKPGNRRSPPGAS